MIDHSKSTGQDLLVDAKVFGCDDDVSRRAFQPCRVPSAMRIERAKLAIPRLSDYQKAEKIYQELKKQNIDVLLDDVDENMSNKFKKHDLIGVPYQIIVGSKSEEDNFEFKELNSKSEILSLDKIIKKIKN